MTLDTTMLASNVPDHNKRRAVVADKPDKKDAKKGGKFKKAFTAKYGEKFPPAKKK